MFRICNGRFIGRNISFNPPENFYMVVRRAEFFDDGVMFISNDGSIKICITFEKDAPSEQDSICDFIEEHDYLMLGDIHRVKHGTRSVFAVYYCYEKQAAGSYMEVFNFKTNKYLENQVAVNVELDGWRKSISNNIYAVMALPQIKEFFNSLEYHSYSLY